MTDSTPSSPGRRRFLGSAAATGVLAAVGSGGVQAAGKLAQLDPAPNAWIEVDLEALERNLQRVRAAIQGGAALCAVLKANAYGTGIENVLPRLMRAGVDCVGIASTEEARQVRACGFKGRVLRVRVATADEVEAAFPYRVEELVGNLDNARVVQALASRKRRTLPVHLALNSAGMSRNGLELATDDGRAQARAITALQGLRIVGLMTHFPGEDRDELLGNVATFKAEAQWLFDNTALRREDVQLHAANSYALQNVPEAHLDMVRPGGALYGYGGTPKPPYEHVAAFKTRVALVNAYRAGSTVSYDRTYTLKRDSLLANLPVGYSDGYRRAFSNKGHVLVRGQRAPVVGRVTMNTTMVDVTDIPGVQPGDEVVLFGRQGDAQISQAEVEEVTGVILADQYTVWGYTNPIRVKP